ncbi:MAG: trimethylamine methyltransferase family protein [Alphaproteobacteria bacterium]
MIERERKSRRGGGRSGREKTKNLNEYPAYAERKINFFEPYSNEQINKIINDAEVLLEEVGIDFRDDSEVLEIWEKAGASIENNRVRFKKGMLREILKTAPSEFIQHARNPKRNVKIGGKNTVYVPAYGSPFVRDLENGRRYATIADFQNLVKLAYMLPGCNHSGGTVCEPTDIVVNKRHLDMIYSHMKYSDKPFMGSVTAPQRAQDTVDMCKILFGEDFVDQNCVVINLINANSPMVYDDTMLGALKVYAKNNQACIISPFILAGAMSPVTVVATLTQIVAEAMAGMALTQLVRKGAPVVFGTFASTTNLQTGAPSFGGPESSLILYGAAQVARTLKIPFRSGGGLNASKLPDAQSAYEATNTLTSATNAGVNFMLHSHGWLEGGLVMSFEKFIMDAEQTQGYMKFLNGPDMSDNGCGIGSWQEVGVGKHFLGCTHTQNNFRTAFYNYTSSDSNSFEQWESEGEKTLEMRANERKKELLASYQAPEIDTEIDNKLQEFIKNKKDSMPDANY